MQLTAIYNSRLPRQGQDALCARRTDHAHFDWITRSVLSHGKCHPAVTKEPPINAFLTHLALKERFNASTQSQARAGLLLLYRHVLGREVGELGTLIRARKPSRVPVVLARDDVKAVLGYLQGNKWLMASLIDGTGLRLMERLHLQLQDVDCARSEITIRDGKGAKDRVTMLPASLKAPLEDHLRKVKAIHEKDVRDGYGRVPLPDALYRKYPNA